MDLDDLFGSKREEGEEIEEERGGVGVGVRGGEEEIAARGILGIEKRRRGRGNGGIGKIIYQHQTEPDPFYSYIPPEIFQLIENTSKEFEDLIDGIPDDLGAKNVKLIIKLASALSRAHTVTSYATLLTALQHGRLADYAVATMIRQQEAAMSKDTSKDLILEKLSQIPTKAEVLQYIGSMQTSATAANANIEKHPLYKTAEKMHNAATTIVEKAVDRVAENIAEMAAKNTENIKENPLQTKLYDMIGKMTDVLLATTPLGKIAAKEGVSADKAFEIK